jgi:enoyl-CoA hydratase
VRATVRAERLGVAGLVTLDRPEALNALDLAMIRTIRSAVEAFLADAGVARVVIRSAHPRAFSAGGDIRAIRSLVLAGDAAAAMAFFREEFDLNHRLGTAPKPVVALIDGICMGGGMGLAMHDAIRIATPGSVFAMPETAIGYVTDVGATHVLSRLPPGVGLWLGLTGARLGGADAKALGLVTHLVDAASFPAILALLSERPPGDLDAALARFTVEAPSSLDEARRAEIARLFGAGPPAAICAALTRDGSSFAKGIVARLPSLSPNSIAQVYDLIRKGEGADLRACLDNELAAVATVIRHPDFAEGVRAVVLDKDRKPRWQRPVDPASPCAALGEG